MFANLFPFDVTTILESQYPNSDMPKLQNRELSQYIKHLISARTPAPAFSFETTYSTESSRFSSSGMSLFGYCDSKMQFY